MEEPNPNQNQDVDLEKTDPKNNDLDKKTILNFLGVEITAPKGMANPLIKLSGLLIINLALLLLLRYALNKG
ncbi:hypothetical protein [Prochlorococcus sp. MIT 1300]|uniref:hypothetical protein n=1 Tax=Prochlorococcus sp. MIT 1300 TaxID=3096218 RepID=UPI002A75BB83|nr:hypothetical protein [Prochlorococcus sp. MIT 1300]